MRPYNGKLLLGRSIRHAAKSGASSLLRKGRKLASLPCSSKITSSKKQAQRHLQQQRRQASASAVRAAKAAASVPRLIGPAGCLGFRMGICSFFPARTVLPRTVALADTVGTTRSMVNIAFRKHQEEEAAREMYSKWARTSAVVLGPAMCAALATMKVEAEAEKKGDDKEATEPEKKTVKKNGILASSVGGMSPEDETRMVLAGQSRVSLAPQFLGSRTKNGRAPDADDGNDDDVARLIAATEEDDEEDDSDETAPVVSRQDYEKPQESTNFRMLAQLESREERHQLQLALMLHELHQLAQESTEDEGDAVVTEEDDALMEELIPLTEDAEDLIHLDPRDITPESATDAVEALRRGGKFDRWTLLHVLEAAADALRRESSLVDISDCEGEDCTVTVVGDLHGSLECTTKSLSLLGGSLGDGKTKVVFAGDFVDRGYQSLEVICTVLLLKLAYPSNVFLVRGNHEDLFLSTVYGFKDEVQSKYGGGKSLEGLWDAFSKVFSALPIVVKTKTAAVLHGGLPSEDFHLDMVKGITTEARSKVDTFLEPDHYTDKLIQGITWSDPTDEFFGVVPNEERGAGVLFGRDVARDFLERHGLKYIVRGHQPAERGWEALDCGDGMAVLTVFSVASYPNGEGINNGAVVRLADDGTWAPFEFSLRDEKEDLTGETAIDSVVGLISGNRKRLEDAFRATVGEETKVTRDQWAEVMASNLDIPDRDFWRDAQRYLAPTTIVASSDDEVGTEEPSTHVRDTSLIDWKRFLDLHSVESEASNVEGLDDKTSELLMANHSMLLTVFKFLDTDGNGMLDREEFETGLGLMNKRLPEDRQLGDSDSLFKALDLDGNGVIELDEFAEVFKM